MRQRRQRPDGSLAQLGEHLPYKQRVTGSSPVGPIFFVRTGFGLCFFYANSEPQLNAKYSCAASVAIAR